MTRDQQFRKSFGVYMEKAIEDMELLNLMVWTLTSRGLNGFGANTHNYTLVIPKKRELYQLYAENSIETEEIEQMLPDMTVFRRHFDAYFKSYILKKGSKIVSYIEMEEDIFTEDNLCINVNVIYHRGHIPYPHNNVETEKVIEINKSMDLKIKLLEVDIQTLHEDIGDKDQEIGQLHRKLRLQKTKTVDYIEKYNHAVELRENNARRAHTAIREFYSNSGKKEDCPVCYEPIPAEKLVVPGCCHYICTTCATNCTSCPICREVYVLSLDYYVGSSI